MNRDALWRHVVGRRIDGPHLHQHGRHRQHVIGEVVGRRHPDRDRHGRVVAAVLVDVERHRRGEDRLAALQCFDAPGRERAPVAVAAHLHDRGVLALAGPEVVAVQRVGEAPLGHGEPRRPQGLGRHLPAIEVVGERLARVVGPVEVAVELLEVEELLQRLGAGELWGRRHPVTVSAARHRSGGRARDRRTGWCRRGVGR